MTRFYSNEEVSLDKTVDKYKQHFHTKEEDFAKQYDITFCETWIRTNNFEKVCLQFPDYLLRDSSEVAIELQNRLNQTIYILGDTAYNSCCVDYVAAAHVDADAVIHFGMRCFSKCSYKIPTLFVPEKYDLNIDAFHKALVKRADTLKDPVVVLDHPFLHYEQKLQDVSIMCKEICTVDKINSDYSLLIYIGEKGRKLLHLKTLHYARELYYFDDSVEDIVKYEIEPRILKRRNFLAEKIRDSQTLGIIIGTVAVQNYLEAISHLKKLIIAYGKTYYLISVGKPTVAKLANFPEIDVYVLLSCAMSELYESRDFYKPIVTPYDVESALNPKVQLSEFSYDFNTFLPNMIHTANTTTVEDILDVNQFSDVSLISGKIRIQKSKPEYDAPTENKEQGLIFKSDNTVSVKQSGASYLAERSWKGLEQKLGQSAATVAIEGRHGLAQSYENESETVEDTKLVL